MPLHIPAIISSSNLPTDETAFPRYSLSSFQPGRRSSKRFGSVTPAKYAAASQTLSFKLRNRDADSVGWGTGAYPFLEFANPPTHQTLFRPFIGRQRCRCWNSMLGEQPLKCNVGRIPM